MAYPPNITLRTVTIGGATTLESGEQLSLVAEIKSSRSLMWGATGWQFHAVLRTITGNDGEELSLSLPVTDLAGWRLLDNPGSAIDVSAPGSYTHTYTIKLTTLSGGRPVAVRTIGPFVLPAEDLSPVDLDLMLPVGTQAGGVVLVPDSWSARLDALEAGGGGTSDAPRRGPLVTLVGSSIARGLDSTRGIGGAGTDVVGGSWFSWATFLSGQRILRGVNAGVIGNTTQMILDRLDSDVLAQSPLPHFCIVYCGSNDAVDGVTPSQYAINIQSIITRLLAAGITPILSTIVPSINSPAYVTCNTYNTIIRRTAARRGLHLLDFGALMVDPTTGAQKAEFVAGGGDGVHPGPEGYRLMGQYVADTLAPHMPASTVDLVSSPLDPTNLITNGLFLGAETAGRAPAWQQNLFPAGATYSVIDAPSVALGRMQRVTAVATASHSAVSQHIDPPKFAPGDRLSVAARFNVVSTSGTVVYIYLVFVGSVAPTSASSLEVKVSGTGTTYHEFVVPSGTTRITVMLRVASGTATLDIGQLTVRNLTALGLA